MKITRAHKRLLVMITLITFIIPLFATGGTVFKDRDRIIAEAKWFGGDYDNVAIELVGATAFADARDNVKFNGWTDTSEDFYNNLKDLCSGSHFGNVGLFIGPRGTSKNSDMWSILNSKVSINGDQIKQFDENITGGSEKGPFQKYKLFGGAIQHLNDRAMKSKGVASSAEQSLLSVTGAATMVTGLFTDIYLDYDPTPVVNALIDHNKLTQNPNNKLCKFIIENPDAYGFFEFMGNNTMSGIPNFSNSLFILSLCLMVGLGISVIMMLINGRTAGEGIRKIIWKFVLAVAGIPIFLNISSIVVNSLDDMVEEDQVDIDNDYISKHLDFADWYATGFNIPDDMELKIDADGEFVFTQSDIKKLNEYVHSEVYGTSDADAIETTIKNYYTQYKSNSMEIAFSEPMTQGSSPRMWASNNYYKIMDNVGNIKPWNKGVDGEKDSGGAAAEDDEAGKTGYLFENGLDMTIDATTGSATITSSGKRFGISPIAATNLMRTSFTGDKMTSSDKTTTMGSVAFNAYNTVDNNAKMPGIIRFITVIIMMKAAIDGIIKVFAAGFMGMIGGGAKTALGSSQGFGQMIGGLIAIALSLLTSSAITTLTLAFLNNMYGLVQTTFSAGNLAETAVKGNGPLKVMANAFGLRGTTIFTTLFIG